jgi:hypothetical protein
MTSTPGVMESIAALVGNHMTKEETAELKQHLKQQAERGKQRKAAKKSGSSKRQAPRTA